jgi:DMSO/TMAO reductase YedYZ molybdopterin-dependent catalytic subunit
MKRRTLLAGLATFLAGGCAKLAGAPPFSALLSSSGDWNRRIHRLLGGRIALAREFKPADISPFFRGNGTTQPDSADYAAHAAKGFAEWRLDVIGLVETPLSLSINDIKALPPRTQITRHDCVEGWSAIGQWTGVPLGLILERAGLRPDARYIVFRCADRLGGTAYYESIDLIDAFHPQTIIAYALNGDPLPIANGAPLRVRIERQLGYKHAKYLNAIEVVENLQQIAGGRGGYWEDRSHYQWYAGI